MRIRCYKKIPLSCGNTRGEREVGSEWSTEIESSSSCKSKRKEKMIEGHIRMFQNKSIYHDRIK